MSAVAHELGHAAGLDHADRGVMHDYLAAGTRTVSPVSVPTRTSGASAPSAAGLPSQLDPMWQVPQARNSTDVVASLIDWAPSVADSSAASKRYFGKAAPGWLNDFINHSGQSEAQRNPNANLRWHVEPSAKVSPSPSASSFHR